METSPEEVCQPQSIVIFFSLVSAQNDQSYEPCRCFLIATHALSLLKGQDTENNPKWWTRRDSNALPPACKAGALPAELLAQINAS